jgi:hypothetical protein
MEDVRMHFRETGWEGVDLKHLAKDKGQWWGFVNTIINLRVPQKARNSTLAE